MYINSADPFAQGFGLLQVEKTFDHIRNYHKCVERDVRFNVSCGHGGKGIHIRQGPQESFKDVLVTVEPFFKDEKNIGMKY